MVIVSKIYNVLINAKLLLFKKMLRVCNLLKVDGKIQLIVEAIDAIGKKEAFLKK